MRKRQNGEYKVGNFACVLFGINTDVPAFQIRVFIWFLQMTLDFELIAHLIFEFHCFTKSTMCLFVVGGFSLVCVIM